MLKFAAARIGDPVTHDLLIPSGLIAPPLVPPPPTAGAVMIEGLPAAFVTCTVTCSGATSAGAPAHPPPGAGAPPAAILIGSTSVRIFNRPAARWAPSGDSAACLAQLGDQKMVPLRTVFIGGPVTPGLPKAIRYGQRKHSVELAKWKADQLPDGDEKEELTAAAERFERNIKAAEMAKLSQNVYNPDQGPPEGWKNVSDDSKALEKIGLTERDLSQPGSDYRAQVYQPDPAVFGPDMKTTVAFKGTTTGEDWGQNFKQGVNAESTYYRNATQVGTRLDKADAEVEITGHSLGGGMASAASRASGRDAWTFNSAGLHDKTVERYGGTVHEPAVENITAYRVENEALTGLQEQGLKGTATAAGLGFRMGGPWGAVIGAALKIGLSAAMPNALGSKYELPGSWDPAQRHFMSQVIAGIEAQKEEDQKAISEGLEGD